jgi:hypothetical protein
MTIELLNDETVQKLELTFTAPRISQLQLTGDMKKLPTGGSCNRAVAIAMPEVLRLLMGMPIENQELMQYYYQVQLFKVMQGKLDENSLSMPPVYKRILTNWRKHGVEAKDIKPALPAIVPSVQFLSKPGLYDYALDSKGARYYTNRSLVSVDGTSWRHTGIFGIDVDLKENPEHTADSILATAQEKLPSLDGFLFAYVSPNRGIKAFFQISNSTLQYLNQNPQVVEDEGDEELNVKRLANERIYLHKAVYHALAQYIHEQTGFILDMACTDPARMQFFYLDTFIPGTPGTPRFHVPDMDKAKADYLQYDKDRAVSYELPSVAPGSPRPKIFEDFLAWLKVNEYYDTAEGLSRMDYIKGDGCLYSECPQCKGGKSGNSQNTDLRFYPDPQYPRQSYFHCFHASCNGANPEIVSVQWLFDLYLTELDAEAEKKAGVEPWCQDPLLMKCFMQGIAPSNMNAAIPEVSRLKLCSLKFPYVRKNKAGKSIPILTDENIKYLLHHGLNLRVFRRMNTNDLLLLDFKNSRWYEVSNSILSKISSFWQLVVPGQAIPTQRLQDALASISQTNYYHPLATFVSSRPWDGQDRLRIFLDFLPMNQDVDMPEGWTPDKYRDMVLTTWLITLWKRVTHRLSIITNTSTSSSFPQNYIPMLMGSQGLGKTKATDWLFRGIRGDVASSIEGLNNADSVVQMARHSAIILDEIDEEVSNKVKESKLKRIITGEADSCRVAFSRTTGTYEYCASIIGSTNQEQVLRDTTGSRRYYPLILGERTVPKDGLPPGFSPNSWAVEKLFEQDNQQLWAQIKYMVDAHEDGEYKWANLEKVGAALAEQYASCRGNDTDLTKYLVPVALKDTDKKGERLSKQIPGGFTSMENILKYVRGNHGDGAKVERWDAPNFKRDLIAVYGADSMKKHNVTRRDAAGQSKCFFFMPLDLWLKEASAETKARVFSQYEHIKVLAEDEKNFF